jgi:hypothetical protein
MAHENGIRQEERQKNLINPSAPLSGHGLTYLNRHFPGGTEKNHTHKSVRIISARAKILPEHLLNTSVE